MKKTRVLIPSAIIMLLSLSSCSPGGGITSERRSELIEMNRVETFAAFEGCPSSKLALGVCFELPKQMAEGFDPGFEFLPLILASGFKNYGEPLRYNTDYYGQTLFSYYPWEISGSELANDRKIFFNMMKDLTHFNIENRTDGEYSPDPESYRYATC